MFIQTKTIAVEEMSLEQLKAEQKDISIKLSSDSSPELFMHYYKVTGLIEKKEYLEKK